MSEQPRPADIGIVGIEVYFPRYAVSQKALEKFDGVPAGKYTIGLGQENMAFVGDREDINSICLTVTKSLLEKYNVDPKSIGFLAVGTETIIDKSKAVKTTLMDLFAESGNFDIEGIDLKNACYGGTAALLHAFAWLESSAWDGRLGLVVAADIAVYAAGNARPTGGCGAVAILVGPDAPLALEPTLRATHMENVYDFYKPAPTSEYPVVDGKLSIECYLRAVDNCYDRFGKKYQQKTGKQFCLDGADYFIFHSPYNKLVQKSLARLMLNDFLKSVGSTDYSDVQQFKNLKLTETYFNANVERAFLKKSVSVYKKKVNASTILPRQLGNNYCGSVYSGLQSLISFAEDDLIGKRIVLFSYGSGLTASMFSFIVRDSVKHFAEKVNLAGKLSSRIFVKPSDFVKTLELREERYLTENYEPIDSIDDLAPGTYYLTKVDKKNRRFYERKPLISSKL
eukprot:TRINITY_DN4045_c0_g1_i1.p1 TRINITY_DN4045_c0_g1~~TRINITY_DN4045_c0_g1_i1.p1  ORF type:complete len:471 (-),score=68.09 TRINITY_DN4045_c0_g1_i1:119-1480(-)